MVRVELPPVFAGDEIPDDFKLVAAPRADGENDARPMVIPAAVVGLYPMANQGLLRDMQALVNGEPATGPIESFLKVGVSLEPSPVAAEADVVVEKRMRNFAEERLVSVADPCQARAVRLARTSRGLVVHGPPGTGKSQTIANVVGDHLARGERILFVCDKRTALDVVLNRLDGMGLGGLCGIVHDPQRDQRELYKSIREQVDGLADLRSDASADGKLAQIDADLQKLHTQLTEYHAALMKRPDKDSLSFHELMGRWLETPSADVEFDAKLLPQATRRIVDEHGQLLSDLFDRAAKAGYPSNPWMAAAGLLLEDYLTTPAQELREEAAAVLVECAAVNALIDPAIPPLPPDTGGGRDALGGPQVLGLSPSPGTPGEGWGGGELRPECRIVPDLDLSSPSPHPNAPPEYQGRGKENPPKVSHCHTDLAAFAAACRSAADGLVRVALGCRT